VLARRYRDHAVVEAVVEQFLDAQQDGSTPGQAVRVAGRVGYGGQFDPVEVT
jgi:hypothetical protein